MSIVWVPIIILFIFDRLMKINYDISDVVVATAIAIGIDITTTLTSGMYITFGFLKYVSSRLKPFGFNIIVPKHLFAYNGFLDVEAMPTYISLAVISLGGAFIAYAMRTHFLDKERLKYPIAVAAATITQTLKNIKIGKGFFLTFLLLGFALQMTYFATGLSIDYTPITSMLLPGAVFAVSFSPLLFALLMLLPLGSLRSFSIGSLLTYLLFIPMAVKLFGIQLLPSQSYDDMLFSVAPVILSYNVGFIVIFLLFYIIRYWSLLARGLSIVFKFNVERTAFATGLAYIIFLGVLSILFAITFMHGFNIAILLVVVTIVVFLHLILIIGNLRVVGESGTGSQALFPLVTIIMYIFGIRNVTLYAMLDPYTGIPMPQVAASTSMNLFRFARFNRANLINILKYFCLGVFVGSFITYIYGNLLVGVYGFNSSQMPLTRWIPTVVWMAAVYQGKLTSQSLNVIFLASLIAILVLIANKFVNILIFPFLVGITLPPDIGIQTLLAYVIKSIIVKFGVSLHEKVIIGSIIFMLGAALALIVNIVLTVMGVNIAWQ
ncbi:hypothetical protein QPL79_06850 [Ignisphaera sp. 4213-co]|uniref:Uncharacterized protein n=1 Tax=Ignisphaera cupida TaxID=3050454 RepID=A0ABD4ZAG3_9CREN|nr:hypothetical protein [Ignisphaera sp. 4213-co]MDK6029078.1 hypothetical protein [Ignisphaera sp. 4213-co]